MTVLAKTVFLITGATGGFGQELTRQLLAAGSRLILSDRTIPSRAELVATLPAEQPGIVLSCLEADLSQPEGAQLLFDQVQKQGFEVDGLINNAGLGLFGRMDELPTQEWEQLMQVNLLSPMRLCALFTPAMVQRRRGHLVNISSLAGWVGRPGLAPYSTSKFGLRGFSEALYHELRPHNIQVTVVYPFFSRTPILNSKQYGSLVTGLAQGTLSYPEGLLTDPAEVMQATLKAVERNQLHVFPDRPAQILQRLKRFTPGLLDWLLSKR
jgi:short-subunit dehydrogenase